MYDPKEIFRLQFRKLTLSVARVRPGRGMIYQGCIDGIPYVVASNKPTALGRLLRIARTLSGEVH